MDVSFSTSGGKKFVIEIWFFSTVREIKEKIHKHHGYPISDQKLFFNGRELADDDRDTEYYDILQSSHLHLKLLSPPEEEVEEYVPAALPKVRPLRGSAQSKGLKVMVVSKCGTRKIPVEVKAAEKVSELRKELQRLQHGEMDDPKLPPGGNYFFIYKQKVMEDDRTFRWHGVKQGDTIEIFNGIIADGSQSF